MALVSVLALVLVFVIIALVLTRSGVVFVCVVGIDSGVAGGWRRGCGEVLMSVLVLVFVGMDVGVGTGDF